MALGAGLVIDHGVFLDGTEILLAKKLPFSIGEFVVFLNFYF
ncbi:hypothetical protein [Thermaerobacillus caldiproteolyticus]|nr:hypothetical protein [Anoxybacillus caldiproteolyticus]